MTIQHADPQAADDRPEVYLEDGVTVIRASAMGGCIRNMVAARKGIRAIPFSEKSLQRMNEGVIHEPHIMAHLASVGWRTLDTQAVLELPIAGGSIVIRGHSDGTVRHEQRNESRVAEVKAQGAGVWEKWRKCGWDEFRRYAYQLSIYMAITGLPGLFATKNRDTGEIDISYWDEAPISVAQLKARAIKIATMVDLPECDPGGGVSLWGCQRSFIHTGDHEIDPFTGLEVKKGTLPRRTPVDAVGAGTGATAGSETVPQDQVAAFEELARSYHEAKAEVARAEAKRKEVGEFLLAFLKDWDTKKGATDNWEVREVERNDSRVDTKSLQVDHPDLAAQYIVKSTSRYVAVKCLGALEVTE